MSINSKGEFFFRDHNSCIYEKYISKIDNTGFITKKVNNKINGYSWLSNEYSLLQEKNICGVIQTKSLDRVNDQWVLILEEFSGIFLADYLREKQLRLDDFLAIAIQLSSICHNLHQAGIVHQGINPESILINPSSLEVKLTNLSFATKISQNNHNSTQQLDNLLLNYISPEQTGKTNHFLDFRADIYSLGCILFYLLSGKPPFTAKEPLELIHYHLAKTPVFENEIEPVIKSIILKLLAKNPQERYQSAWGLKQDLLKYRERYQAQEQISFFRLGTLDKKSNFVISKHLYGCETAVATFKSSLEYIKNSGAELIAVRGDVGSGKTSLVKNTISKLIGSNDIFVEGDLREGKDSNPYYGIRSVFNNLVNQLLILDSKIREKWREKIIDSLGINAKIITDILPELELIIGTQKEIPELSGKEAENRFNLAFTSFIRIFIQENSRLIIFLDDMQFVDSSSLKLLSLLLKNLSQKRLLIICTFQENLWRESDNKINNKLVDNNACYLWIESLKTTDSNIKITEVLLSPLTVIQIEELIKDTLEDSNKNTLYLAKIIWQRSQGNQLFVNGLFQSFYDDGLIYYDYDNLKWDWELTQLVDSYYDNHYLTGVFASIFDQSTSYLQIILQTAACIDDEFDYNTLLEITRLDEKELIDDLSIAIQKGLIIVPQGQVGLTYRFLNLRFQKYIYNLLDYELKKKIHYAIGKYLVESSSKNNINEKIFTITHHLNLSRSLTKNLEEREFLAELNLIAAKVSKKAIAYDSALSHLQVAIDLLPNSTWQNNHDLIFELHLEVTEIFYLLANYDQVDRYGNIALAFAWVDLEKAKVYEVIIRSKIACNQMEIAIDLGMLSLEILNLKIDTADKQDVFIDWLINIDDSFTETFSKVLSSECCDQHALARMNILSLITPPIYIAKPYLFPTIVFMMVRITLESGYSKVSSFAFALYGLLLCSSGKIDYGYKLAQIALDLKERLKAKDIAPKVDFVINNTIRHWHEPFTIATKYLYEGINQGIELGDIEHACFSAKYYCVYLFIIGKPLKEAQALSSSQIKVIEYLKQSFQYGYACIWQQLNLNFQGTTEQPSFLIGSSFDESKYIPLWQEQHNITSLFALYLAKSILNFHLKNYQQAYEFITKCDLYIEGAIGTVCYSIFYFYAALIKLSIYTRFNDQANVSLDSVIKYCKQLKMWANHSPDNYLNKYYLVVAELARVLNKDELAVEYYDRAIDAATKVEYLSEIALAEELAGEYYLKNNKKRIASYYLNDAFKNYAKWQAAAKLKLLSELYPDLITNNYLDTFSIDDSSLDSEYSFNRQDISLDFLSVLKATQAISSEIVLESLLSKMIKIVIENAGAEKGILILQDGMSWMVAASGSISPEMKVSTENIPLTEYEDIPLSIINYIKTKNEPVILKDALINNLFVSDPYIKNQKPKSILAYPMIHKNHLQGIIYLENNLLTNAFKQENIEILKVLVSQVTISIENARLYKDLENHASVQKSLKQKEVLLKEIHHRVKNNLLVVSSLLELQSDYVKDQEVIKLLENCQNRISSMALVHKHLYGTKGLNKVNLANYIEALIEQLTYSQASDERNINLVCDLDGIEVNIETANPCGLIINELVSNCLEHGFKNRDRGNIWISLKQNLTGTMTLVIQDDGIGFKEGMTLQNSDSLGLELVCTLVDQLDGEVSLDCTEGTKIEINFTELGYESRI